MLLVNQPLPDAADHAGEILHGSARRCLVQEFQLRGTGTGQERLDETLLRAKQEQQHARARSNRLRQRAQRQARQAVLQNVGIGALEQLDLPRRGGSTLTLHCTTLTETIVSVKVAQWVLRKSVTAPSA